MQDLRTRYFLSALRAKGALDSRLRGNMEKFLM
ncbi:hypothetical protein [Coxiella burnetii]|uniref:Uncharacterized protein n=2 Tax=Coxiella burnetii TaxID=777 RepID=Q83BG7_COXBU|nr:hypothetical protein [Coxiella burnetii]NP_820524.1 hypothetical protein CBU_1541 [Coxiella burnetii RSA 493]AAO91038.1 hypothetical protein CBU_1541 [Coxiella burnetii RSA 493]ACI23102.1 hypothetical protein CBUD_0446a [Coxiella burnetii Dugway 5J108-111]ACJ17894.1 hypothetical protein CbuG_0470 [Coxiella burnetii CbuG_Q212]ACJ20896.1 hypothetical protein CbuK_1767 [Coxiella burnetii CbuK_Q154]AML48556.1 hypothetical protein AUR58_04720 [Coxiella burnetii]